MTIPSSSISASLPSGLEEVCSDDDRVEAASASASSRSACAGAGAGAGAGVLSFLRYAGELASTVVVVVVVVGATGGVGGSLMEMSCRATSICSRTLSARDVMSAGSVDMFSVRIGGSTFVESEYKVNPQDRSETRLGVLTSYPHRPTLKHALSKQPPIILRDDGYDRDTRLHREIKPAFLERAHGGLFGARARAFGVHP
jgi:hypothetical protein